MTDENDTTTVTEEVLQPGEEVLNEPVIKDINDLEAAPDEGGETPTDEVTEEVAEELSIDDFKKEMGLEDVVPPTDKKKVDDKTEETPLPKSDDPLLEAPAKLTSEFDYSGFTDNEQKLLKKMAIPARQWAATLVKERRELQAKLKTTEKKVEEVSQGKLPPSYYDNEKSYVLTKDYEELREDASTANAVLQHWEEQVIRAEAGEDWQDLDVDPRTGKLVLGEKQTVTPEAKVQLRRYLRHAEVQLESIRSKAREFATKHKEQVVQRKSFLGEQEKRYFPQFEKKEFAGWKIANQVLEELKQHGLDDNPLAPLVAKAAAANTMLVNYINTKLTGKTTQAKVTADAKLAGPGKGLKSAAAPSKKAGEVTMDDFNKELGRA